MIAGKGSVQAYGGRMFDLRETAYIEEPRPVFQFDAELELAK